MPTLEELLVEIKADTSGLLSGLKEAQDSVASSTKTMKDAIDQMSTGSQGSISNFTGAWQVLEGVVGADTIMAALNLLKDAVKEAFDVLVVEGVRASIEQEDAMNRLNNAFARAGEYSKQASQDFVGFADEMQRTTKYSNDAVISTGGLIESLAQLDEKGLKQATKAAMDLASGLGVDLNTAALLVGKAAEGNISTFSRYGLVIQTGSDNAETFANALQAINEKFGGNAATEAQTFSGSISQLSNAFKDFQKQVGDAFVQNPAVLAVIKQLTDEMVSITDSTKGMNTELKSLVGEGLIDMIKAGEVLIVTLDAMARVGTSAFSALRAAADTTLILLNAKTEIFSTQGRAHLKALSDDAVASFKRIGTAFTEQTGLEKIGNMLADLQGAAQVGFDKIGTAADKQVEPINRHKGALKSVNDEVGNMIQAGSDLIDSLTKVTTEFQTEYDKQTAIIKDAEEKQTISHDQAYEKQLNALRIKTNNEALLIKASFDAGKKTKQQYEDALSEIEKKQDTEAAKLSAERTKKEEEDNKKRAQNLQSTLGYISTLQRSSNKELFFIGQQAAAAQATIDGIAAVQKALASAPPPFNFALAALVGVATAANVAQIEGQSAPGFAGGIDSVPGSGFKDNFPSMLAPGEGVITSDNNKKLTRFLSGDGEQTQLLRAIADGVSRSGGQGNGQIHIHIGGKTLVESLNDELRGGRKLAI